MTAPGYRPPTAAEVAEDYRKRRAALDFGFERGYYSQRLMVKLVENLDAFAGYDRPIERPRPPRPKLGRPRLRRANYWDGWGGVREKSLRRAAFGESGCWRSTDEGRRDVQRLQDAFGQGLIRVRIDDQGSFQRDQAARDALEILRRRAE